MKRLIFVLSLTFILSNLEAQNTLVKRIQYDVQINSEAQNEIVSLHNIPASTRLDFLNALFESVKKGETKAYTLQHSNSFPVYSEVKKKEVEKQFVGKKEYTIVVTNPHGDPDDPYDLIDTVISEDFNVTPLNISHIRFIEKWEEDVNGKIIKTIESFAPVYSKSSELSYSEYSLTPLFWVKLLGMKNQSWTMNLLSETQIINGGNDNNWFVSNIEAPFRIEWMTKVFEKAKKGEISACNDFICSKNLTVKEIDSLLLIQYEIYTFNDYGEEGFEIVSIEIQPNEITKLIFYEVWTIDSKLGFRKEIINFAPLYSDNNDMQRTLFWIKIEGK